MTWIEQIEAAASGEPILLVRFGRETDIETIGGPEIDLVPTDLAGTTLEWDAACEALTAGEAQADYLTWPILAWTESRVIFTHDYDTMRDFKSLPRNPDGEWGGECVGDE